MIIVAFLYIDPIKQGLKQDYMEVIMRSKRSEFLYIDPIKQGLKPRSLLHLQNQI
mgnify:CR=1 FL=1